MMKPPAKENSAARADGNHHVAAGFFFALDFAAFGGATGSGPRSIEVKRPDVKV
jgi:hypothetical protein